MKELNCEYTDKCFKDSITQEMTKEGLIIESENRVYFISKEFIDFAYKFLHERENKDKT